MGRKIGEIADDIYKIQEEVKKLNAKIKVKEDGIIVLKTELVEAAAVENLFKGGGNKSQFKIEDKVVPQATDWDAFYAYMSKNKYYHLLTKRLTVTGCSELWELGKKIPGIEKFTKTEVTVKGA